ncbi:hypothetical protein GPECTOR_8g47 [Gonium pectorale]|uniref:Uncharacterized protein n=1 Tax=Gonium pectorale TaxID=33097 RepID=A0A150GTJ9_GONPE|nr:hypothetical protein GPECTOR_8g47 [Gonium pectorale]|eukprot:KXZ53052.1 hypothetical protein GPECTOR_8g47 [Gonium pectorale]
MHKGDVAPEATLPVITQLHGSGVGRTLFATPLESYVNASAAQREALLAGEFFMPCLSAAATGRPLEKLQLDRCARVELHRQGSRICSELAVSDIKFGRLGAQLPAVLDARARILRTLNDRARQQLAQFEPFEQVEEIRGQSVPLTVYFEACHVTPHDAKRLLV